MLRIEVDKIALQTSGKAILKPPHALDKPLTKKDFFLLTPYEKVVGGWHTTDTFPLIEL
jgi:hypothetical protein